jgi:exonuclease SbcC
MIEQEETLLKETKGEKEEEEKLKELKKKKESLQEKRKEIEEKRESFYLKQRDFIAKLSELETQIKEKEKAQEKQEEEIKKIREVQKDYKLLLKREKCIQELIQPLCEELERTLFTKYYTEFNESFQYYFKELIEDQELDIWLSPEDFSPLLEQNGYDSEIKNLSGGEKSSLALAYRLALKKIIEENSSNKQALSLLILDEPTDGFSNEQVNRLGLLLKELSIEQILLVSHDEKIEAITNEILHVEKQNHRSKVI